MSGSGFAPPFNFPLGGPPPSQAQQKAQKDQFGKDLFFDGDVHVTPQGDYLTVEGVENLRRGVLRRLMTEPGEYRVNPTYGVGLPGLLKKPMNKAVLSQLRQRIVQQLGQDRRIDKVITCDLTPFVTASNSGLTVTVVVQAIGRDVRFQPFQFAKEV